LAPLVILGDGAREGQLEHALARLEADTDPFIIAYNRCEETHAD